MTAFQLNTIIFLTLLLIIVFQLFLYPLLIILVGFFVRKTQKTSDTFNYSLSFIIVVHNAENLITQKIENTLSLLFQNHSFEVIVYLDGCSDKTLDKISAINNKNLIWIDAKEHLGKHIGINEAVKKSNSEILIFTDVDALLENDAIVNLLENFNNLKCGGACGQRIIGEKRGVLLAAQNYYIKVDSFIKSIESNIGNISSNDGKIYAIRRKLFQPVMAAVTDDLFQSMSIVEQGYRFVFDNTARAHIRIPVRSRVHELERRRRIISTSLYGIYLKRNLLNPFKFGLYSISLFINKILRRLLPLLLITLFISSCIGAYNNQYILFFFCIQLYFYLFAISYPLLLSATENFKTKLLKRASSICWYFCVGNYATMLGLVDFLKRKRIAKWKPVKEL